MNRYILLLILGIPAWFLSLDATFQYDDHRFLEMPAVKGNMHELLNLYWMGFDPGVHSVRPLAVSTMALNQYLCGDAPHGWILCNLAIHFAAVWLVYRITAMLTGNGAAAFVAAMLFLIHPVTPFAVTYITQSRMEALALVAILASLYLYMKGRTLLWIIPCALGCLCKETAYITPLVILAYAVCFEGVRPKKIIALALIICALFAGGVSYNHCLRHAIFGDNWSLSGGLLGQIQPLMALDILTEYTKRIFWPSPEWLSIDPDYILHQNSVILSALAAGFIIYLIHKAGEQRRVLVFSVLCFMVFMVVPLAILPIKPDDKLVIYKAYPACVPACIFVAVCMASLLDRAVFTGFAITLVLLFSVWTCSVNHSFRSQVALWEDAAEENPARIRPQFNYATAILLERNNHYEAWHAYKETLAIAEDLCREQTTNERECVLKTWYNMGLLQQLHGELEEAAVCYMHIRKFPLAKERIKELEKEWAKRL